MYGFAQDGSLVPWSNAEAGPSYRIETYATAPGEYVVALEGEIDLAARPELDRELELLHDEHPQRVVADLTATTFVDAATLGLLESAQSRLRAAGTQLCLVCTDSHLLKILRLTGVDRVMDIFETVSEAFAANTYSNVLWLRRAAGG